MERMLGPRIGGRYCEELVCRMPAGVNSGCVEPRDSQTLGTRAFERCRNDTVK